MIIAGMATIPGRERACKDAINSIKRQVDVVFLFSEFDVFDLFKCAGVDVYQTIGGDEKKFHAIENGYPIPVDYYFSLDDDLIYPPDYVSRTIAQFTDKPEILTYHGRTITGPLKSYYKDDTRPRAQVLHELENDIYLNVPGTGCMAFRPKDFKLTANDFPLEFPLMADIHVGIAAQRQQIPIRALKHSAGWIRHTDKINFNETIFARHRNNDELHTQRCNSIEWKLYR